MAKATINTQSATKSSNTVTIQPPKAPQKAHDSGVAPLMNRSGLPAMESQTVTMMSMNTLQALEKPCVSPLGPAMAVTNASHP
jgi:hypothetical protein